MLLRRPCHSSPPSDEASRLQSLQKGEGVGQQKVEAPPLETPTEAREVCIRMAVVAGGEAAPADPKPSTVQLPPRTMKNPLGSPLTGTRNTC